LLELLIGFPVLLLEHFQILFHDPVVTLQVSQGVHQSDLVIGQLVIALSKVFSLLLHFFYGRAKVVGMRLLSEMLRLILLLKLGFNFGMKLVSVLIFRLEKKFKADKDQLPEYVYAVHYAKVFRRDFRKLLDYSTLAFSQLIQKSLKPASLGQFLLIC